MESSPEYQDREDLSQGGLHLYFAWRLLLHHCPSRLGIFSIIGFVKHLRLQATALRACLWWLKVDQPATHRIAAALIDNRTQKG